MGRRTAHRRVRGNRRRPRYRLPAACGAARLAQPRDVRRRRCLRRIQVRTRCRGVPLERRIVVGRAGYPRPRADRLDQGHRPDGSQRRHRRRGRRSRGHHLQHRRDGRDAARPVHRRSPRGCRQRAGAGRPDRRSRRYRAGHGRAGVQGPRANGFCGTQIRWPAPQGHHCGAAVTAPRAPRRRGPGLGRPGRRPGRPGGHRRRRRTRPVRLLAHPFRDGGRRRAVGGRRAGTGLDHRADHLGERPQAGLVRRRLR